MKTIYKYTVGLSNFGDRVTDINVPIDAEILSVKEQYGKICAWYLVDTQCESMRTDRWYQIGTGHEYESLRKDDFQDTIVADPYVWHMFVKKNV